MNCLASILNPEPRTPNPAVNPQGLVIVGHGTRDLRGLAEFHALVDLVAARSPGFVVEGGFLELAEPTIADAVARAVQRGGLHSLTVLPLVLFAAGHAKVDIPRAVQAAVQPFPGLAVHQAPHLGCHPEIIELSRRRFREALSRLPAATAGETLLLMVGRGSRDPEANSEMARFARLRWESDPIGWVETCFTDMAEPSLERALEMVTRLPLSTIVVQPHLLFQGELLERIRSTVELFGRSAGSYTWVVADHLGPDVRLAAAVLNLAGLTNVT